MAGIGLVSLNGKFTIEYGDAFTLASGFFYAAHLIAIAKVTKDKDAILITILQFGYAAVLSWVTALLTGDFNIEYSAKSIFGLLYLSVFATAVALLLQNIGQKYTKPAPASVLMSLEAVFGVLFSVMLGYEKISTRLFFGFLLIFISVIISETKLSFLKRSGT
jgi:drug/metabolite transporter (DMT)-like permease